MPPRTGVIGWELDRQGSNGWIRRDLLVPLPALAVCPLPSTNRWLAALAHGRLVSCSDVPGTEPLSFGSHPGVDAFAVDPPGRWRSGRGSLPPGWASFWKTTSTAWQSWEGNTGAGHVAGPVGRKVGFPLRIRLGRNDQELQCHVAYATWRCKPIRIRCSCASGCPICDIPMQTCPSDRG